MANRPADAGAGLTPGDTAAQPLVRPDVPRTVRGHRAARTKNPRNNASPGAPDDVRAAPALAWLPYLIVLAGASAGLAVVYQWSQDATWGTGLVGCSLLAAGLARLVLPTRLAGPLSSRRKTSDVLAFAIFGAGVLAVALLLP
jgi:hypothetical protein